MRGHWRTYWLEGIVHSTFVGAGEAWAGARRVLAAHGLRSWFAYNTTESIEQAVGFVIGVWRGAAHFSHKRSAE
jgi:hypothetical protein